MNYLFIFIDFIFRKQPDCPDTSTNLTLSSQEKLLYELSQQANGVMKIATETNREIYRKVRVIPIF